MIAQSDEYLERAYKKLVDISADEEKRLEYEAREKAIRDHNYLMQANLEQGLKQGMERGLKQGRKEGERIGIIIGIIETLRELGASREDAVRKIIRKFDISEEEARQTVEKYWQ